MPLTQIVNYLNQYLPNIHPLAALGHKAMLRLDHGKLSAEVAGMRLLPFQLPVLCNGRPFARRARLTVLGPRGTRLSAEGLFLHAWEADDVIFLDRFLRTLHALYHLNRRSEAGERLVLDVHVRHLAAVPEQHGQWFEQLLARLGLLPGQIILRIEGSALLADAHARHAARSFAERGYRILAGGLSEENLHDSALTELGISWAAPATALLEQTGHDDRVLSAAARLRAHAIGLWFEQLPASLERKWMARVSDIVVEQGELAAEGRSWV